jgi:hypothetical protein
MRSFFSCIQLGLVGLDRLPSATIGRCTVRRHFRSPCDMHGVPAMAEVALKTRSWRVRVQSPHTQDSMLITNVLNIKM